jgi:hypothetical protein
MEPDTSVTEIVTIRGKISRVIFTNKVSGFAVLSVDLERNKSEKSRITMTGTFRNPVPGITVEAQGRWENHNKYGLQFKAEPIELCPKVAPKAASPPFVPGRIFGIAFVALIAFGAYHWFAPRFSPGFQKDNQVKIDRLKRSRYYTIKDATEYIGYGFTFFCVTAGSHNQRDAGLIAQYARFDVLCLDAKHILIAPQEIPGCLLM